MTNAPAHNETPQHVAGFSLTAYLLSFLVGSISGLAFVQIFGGGWTGLTLGYLSPFLLYLSGLGAGRKPVIVAAVFGILVVTLKINYVVGLVYALMIAVPAMVMSRVALIRKHGQWLSSGSVLQVAILLGSVLLLAVALWLELSGVGIVTVMQGVASNYIAALEQMNTSGEITPEKLEQLAQVFTRLLPGLIMVSWLVVHLINFSFAQYILSEAKKAVRPTFHVMRQLELPRYAAVAFIACVAGANFVGDNVSLVLSAIASLLGVGLMLVGLVILHAMLGTFAVRQNMKALGRFLLFGFYYIVLFAMQIPLILALFMGLADPWVQFRTKLNLIV